MYAEGSPSGPGFALHSDICIPYLLHYGTEVPLPVGLSPSYI